MMDILGLSIMMRKSALTFGWWQHSSQSVLGCGSRVTNGENWRQEANRWQFYEKIGEIYVDVHQEESVTKSMAQDKWGAPTFDVPGLPQVLVHVSPAKDVANNVPLVGRSGDRLI